MMNETSEFFIEIPVSAETPKGAEKIPKNPSIPRTPSESGSSGNTRNAPDEAEGFYVIDYDSGPFKGVGKFVLKTPPQPQKVAPPPVAEKDEVRDLFDRMRDIARGVERAWMREESRFYIARERQDSARVFYKQAMFMKDFTDDFAEEVHFSAYFPCYQMMGYKQLRSYFTWRSRVRSGEVAETSLSYVFLYIYELLNNVGVESPQEGLERLVAFLGDFSFHGGVSLNTYLVRWLKDYFVYYGLEGSFGDFVERCGLERHYPEAQERKAAQGCEGSFDWFCSLSKYDVKKSVFFADGKEELVSGCFCFVVERIREVFGRVGVGFDEAVFGSVRGARVWAPFKDALFFPCLEQADRRVVLSEREVYVCKGNVWTLSTAIASEAGRRFVGYVMRKVESVLRRVAGYRFKLAADVGVIAHELLGKLKESGVSLEKIVEDAVLEFYKEATKTVVTVDAVSLRRIREEALSTQVALSVEEEALGAPGTSLALSTGKWSDASEEFKQEGAKVSEDIAVSPRHEPGWCLALPDGWATLKAALSEIELQALAVVLYDGEVKRFADSKGVMLEVLVDGINGKAMDCVGDSLLDEDLAIFTDYVEQVKGLLP